MPSLSRTSNSKKAIRHSQRTSHSKCAGSDTTSSGADSSDPNAISDFECDVSSNSLSSASEYQPDELDEPITYTFQNGDAVWVKTNDGEWVQGTISGTNTRKGPTRQKEGLFFPVTFRHHSRRYFAPLNGNLKPDNVEVRRLLSEGGWL